MFRGSTFIGSYVYCLRSWDLTFMGFYTFMRSFVQGFSRSWVFTFMGFFDHRFLPSCLLTFRGSYV